MSQDKLSTDAAAMLERQDIERTANQSTVEIKLDDTNKVRFPGYPYSFRALNKKIIVSIDVWKSGYDCKICKGVGKIHIICDCEQNAHPGTKYALDEPEPAKKLMKCPSCNGDYEAARKNIDCVACNGKGALLKIPETSQKIPTTGVVVSIGSRIKLDKLGFKLGDRIAFGPYAGTLVPVKSGLMFKVLDWNQAWFVVEGADELAAFDFITIGTPE